MHEVMPSEEQRDLWDKKTLGQDISWDTIYDGFGSAVDWPSAFYWEELMTVYPDARVILTYRDPESWCSYERTILQSLHRIEASGDLGMALRVVAEGEFSGKHADKEALYRAIQSKHRAGEVGGPVREAVCHGAG